MDKNIDIRTDRVQVLDVTKGVCILMVILTHYDWEYVQRLYGLFPFWVDMAVPIFLMISSYVYCNSFYKNGIERFEQAYDLVLIAKKIIRYTIPFAIALGIEFIILACMGSLPSVSTMVWVFLTGGYGPGSYYYPMMIQFIFVFPIVYFTVRSKPTTGLVGWFIFNAFYELIKKVIGAGDSAYRIGIYRYSFLIALGCYIFLSKSKENKKDWIVSCIVGAIYILVTKYLGYETVIIDNAWRGTSFIAALYIAPIFCAIVKKYSNFYNRPLALLGKASFNIFLTQMVYYAFVAGYVYAWVEYTAVRIVINIFVCILAGMVFYLIESRFTAKFIKVVMPCISKVKEKLDSM